MNNCPVAPLFTANLPIRGECPNFGANNQNSKLVDMSASGGESVFEGDVEKRTNDCEKTNKQQHMSDGLQQQQTSSDSQRQMSGGVR